MGKRSRKRRSPAAAQPASPRPDRAARSEAKNEAVRQTLEPLPEGERPRAVTVSAFVCAALAIANVLGYLLGLKVGGKAPQIGSFVLFEALMLACVFGLWRARYWAVLGFECLLGITLVVAGLSLTVVNGLYGAVVALAILGSGGWLFWKLIRSMARIQMPERPTREDGR